MRSDVKHLAFATFEWHPVNSGGAGVLIAGAVRSLAEAGYRCTVVCAFPDREIATAREQLARENLGPGEVRLVSLESLSGSAAPLGPGATDYERNSARFAAAFVRLHQADPVDLIEFPEYAGMAFATLKARQREGALRGVQIAVRVHGSLELIDQAEGVRVTELGRLRMHRMERIGLRMADLVLVPSASLGEFYRQLIGMDSRRILVAPPPMERLLRGIHSPMRRLVDPGHFVFYGKLQEVKGIDTLLEAAASLVTEEPGRHWRFTIIGRDTPCTAHGQKVSQCIAPLVPRQFRHAFEFVESFDRMDLPRLAERAVAGIVPSRFETFCLAAHELLATGLPLIVPGIPGFQDYLNEDFGCLVFDGTASGLREAILRMREQSGLAQALSRRPMPVYPPFRLAYDAAVERALPPAEPEARWIVDQELAALERMGTLCAPKGPLRGLWRSLVV